MEMMCKIEAGKAGNWYTHDVEDQESQSKAPSSSPGITKGSPPTMKVSC